MKNELAKVFCDINDVKTMNKFFSEIFTEKERKDLELRWELMRLLHQGARQRDICSQLGISLCKITRGSKILKDAKSVSRALLDKFARVRRRTP